MVWMYTGHQKKIDAAVAWYGPTFAEPTSLKPLNPVEVTDKIDRPVLGLYAGAGQSIPHPNLEDQPRLQGSAARVERLALLRRLISSIFHK